MRVRSALLGVLVAVTVVACSSSGDDEPPRVLGTVVERTTTTAPDATTTTTDGSTTTPTTADGGAGTTTVAPTPASRPAPTTTLPRPATTTTVARGESLAAGRYVERSDGSGTLTRSPDGRWNALAAPVQTENPPPPERIRFDVAIGVPEGDSAPVAVTIENTSGRLVRFPGGLRVVVRCTADGGPWREIEVTDATVTALAPETSVSRQGRVDVGAPSSYSCAGETTIELA